MEESLSATDKNDDTLALLELLVQNPDSMSKEDVEKICDAINKETLNTDNVVKAASNGNKLSGNNSFSAAKSGNVLQNVKLVTNTTENAHATRPATFIKSEFSFKPIIVNLPQVKIKADVRNGERNIDNGTNFSASAPPIYEMSFSNDIIQEASSKVTPVFSTGSNCDGKTYSYSFAGSSVPVEQYESIAPYQRIRYSIPRNEQAVCSTEWLMSNFEQNKMTTFPRNIMYQEYIEFCKSMKVRPFNQAVFGKIVRSCFPNLTTRRLGVRGMSRYHYAGLGIRKDSKYSQDETSPLSSANVTRSTTPMKSDHLRTKAGKNKKPKEVEMSTTPTIDDLKLPLDYEHKNSLEMFIKLVESHHKKFICAVIKLDLERTMYALRNFVQTCLLSFSSVLGQDLFVSTMRVFDDMAYYDVTQVLLPDCLGELTTDFKISIRKFAKSFATQLQSLMKSQFALPSSFVTQKIQSAAVWANTVRRITTLCHVAKEARRVFLDAATTKQLLADLKMISIDEIAMQASWCGNDEILNGVTDDDIRKSVVSAEFRLVYQYVADFEVMLRAREGILSYISKLKQIVEKHSGMNSENPAVTPLTQEFLMKWSFYTSKLLTEITLKTSGSVGTFHLITLFFGDYIHHLIATRKDQAVSMVNAKSCMIRGSHCYRGFADINGEPIGGMAIVNADEYLTNFTQTIDVAVE